MKSLMVLFVIGSMYSSIHSSEIRIPKPRPHSPIPAQGHRDLKVSTSEPSSEVSDEDILFSAALDILSTHASDSSDDSPSLVNYIKSIIDQDKTSPLIDMKRLSSGVENLSLGNERPSESSEPTKLYLYSVLVKASRKALADQQLALTQHQQTIQLHSNQASKALLKRNIAIVAGLISTVLTTLIVRFKS